MKDTDELIDNFLWESTRTDVPKCCECDEPGELKDGKYLCAVCSGKEELHLYSE